MGLEDVTQEIREEAEQEAEQIRSEAEEEAEQILQEAEEQADELLAEAEEEAEQEVAALRKKELSNARMDARQTEMEAREAVLQDAFDRFRERLENMDAGQEGDLIHAALERLDSETDIGTVTVAERFADTAEDYGDVETADIRGVIVESADGTRRFDLSFDVMADRVISEHRKAVADELFD